MYQKSHYYLIVCYQILVLDKDEQVLVVFAHTGVKVCYL